ncbi:response regulator [Croceicoccus ponticola]|uniref:histidine kinase n=1 Tax=Croceicoccus ponticola TaxID=2217664 RepID=A0A437GXV5_9SPHN|nr:ATP-binding protein [Croceicoccus ponticola]RVQ67524.1 response regulator [Croceicoccus ponticola]
MTSQLEWSAHRMPQRFLNYERQKVTFWLAIVVLVAAIAFSVLNYFERQAILDSIETKQSILIQAQDARNSLRMAEAGARGFAISESPKDHARFQSGIATFTETFARLKKSSRDNPELISRLANLERLAEREIAISEKLAARDRPDQGSQLVAVSSQTMELFNRGIDDFLILARSIRQNQFDDLRNQRLVSGIALVLGALLSLGLISWLFMLREREFTRRRAVEDELRALNTGLEASVRERTLELERSRDLLDTIIESIPDPIYLKNADDEYRYVFVNEAAEQLFGLPREQAMGRIDHELFPREQANLCRREDRQIHNSGEIGFSPAREMITQQGPRDVESRKIPFQSADGQTLILGVLRDVTDHRRMERQLREMQRMDSLGRLTGGIAHDFNNLLAIIMGNLDLVREELDTSTETALMIDEALGATVRGAELVRRLLAFARKQHLEPVAVDLNEHIPEVLPLLERTLGENVTVQFKDGADLWLALIDPGQVDDALVNLAINARDSMLEGGLLTIETANANLDEDYAAQHVEVDPGEYVALMVSDTGSGMSSTTISRAFEPFFTTKEEGKGTGLGLSQVYGWVKQSGGHIKIYSELGHGTTIKLYLPRSGEKTAVTHELPDATRTSAKGEERVLVVEDNLNVRRTVVRQLHDLGYSTIEADDGQSALEMIRNGVSFDLLFTDIVMPGGMSGYELAEVATGLRPGLRVLLTSGYTELGQKAANPACWPLISKPYRKSELAIMIRTILDAPPRDRNA